MDRIPALIELSFGLVNFRPITAHEKGPTFTSSDRLRVGWLNSGRGTARAEDAQETPTQNHLSPSILVYEDDGCEFAALFPLPLDARNGNIS